MEKEKIQNLLQEVFDDLFIEEVLITPSLTASEVEEWDSILHISLVLAVEEVFGISFLMGEVENTKNLGEFMDLISNKINICD